MANALNIEAGLERNSAEGRAVAFAVRPQRACRQNHVTTRPRAARLDIARNRAIRVNAAIAGRSNVTTKVDDWGDTITVTTREGISKDLPSPSETWKASKP